jgi:hypothetical protein
MHSPKAVCGLHVDDELPHVGPAQQQLKTARRLSRSEGRRRRGDPSRSDEGLWKLQSQPAHPAIATGAAELGAGIASDADAMVR